MRAAVNQTPHREPAPDPVSIRGAWCKRCDICVHFCPQGVLGRDEQGPVRVVAPEACNACRLCELLCPDFAITVKEGGRVARKARGKTDAGERSMR
ncbi:MAG: 4Fe-4S dicluster domain-containing protein [bacterium]|nr:4Fe-4S dicluster domain-containing protein [bacterium]